MIGWGEPLPSVSLGSGWAIVGESSSRSAIGRHRTAQRSAGQRHPWSECARGEGLPLRVLVAELGELGEVLLGGDFFHAELGDVVVGDLGVEEREASGAEVVDEVDEADFAGVGAAEVGAVEHGFAAEDAAEGDAVETADEDVGCGVWAEVADEEEFGGGPWRLVDGEPGLDAVGVALVVEGEEGADDAGAEPGGGGCVVGGVARAGDAGAGADDGGEGVVGGDEEPAGADALGEGAGDAEAVIEGDEGTLAGLDPFDHVIVRAGVGHEEPAAAVALEHERDELFVGAERAVGGGWGLGLVGVGGHGGLCWFVGESTRRDGGGVVRGRREVDWR